MTIFNKGEALYIVGRVSALASRPLFLLIANHFFGNKVAASLAATFLVSVVLLAFFAIDTHRVYYARYFGGSKANAAFGFSRHIFGQIIMTTVAQAACVSYFVIAGEGWPLGLVAAVYFVTEKIADEILRFTLFERNRALWGKLMVIRIVPQAAFFAATALLSPDPAVAAPLLALCLIAGNLIAFAPRLPARAVARLVKTPGVIARQLLGALRFIVNSGNLWLLAMATTFSSYIDRLIILLSSKNDIAIFTLIVSAMSIIQTSVDYFYFSQKRRDFLEGNISFINSIFSKKYIIVLSLSTAAGLIATIVTFKLYRGAPSFPILSVAFITVMQISLATTSIAREVSYWNNQLKAMLKVELCYIALISTFFAAVFFRPNFNVLLAGAAIALMLRLFLFARVTNKRLPIQFA